LYSVQLKIIFFSRFQFHDFFEDNLSWVFFPSLYNILQNFYTQHLFRVRRLLITRHLNQNSLGWVLESTAPKMTWASKIQNHKQLYVNNPLLTWQCMSWPKIFSELSYQKPKICADRSYFEFLKYMVSLLLIPIQFVLIEVNPPWFTDSTTGTGNAKIWYIFHQQMPSLFTWFSKLMAHTVASAPAVLPFSH
jgi:hypothetical protein